MKPALWILAALAAAAFGSPARAVEWLPVTAEDRAATASKIDPDAGAEILYRMKQFDSGDSSTANLDTMGTMTDEYIQIKVFNEKGVRRVSKMEVYCDENETISWLEARVIKPDGSVINVDKKSFFDRQAVRFGDTRVQVRAFAFPQLAPGDIAEYQVGRAASVLYSGARLDFQMDLPARRVLFRIKPIDPSFGGLVDVGPNQGRTAAYYHKCAEVKVTHAPDGYNCVEMRNVPAVKSESYSLSPSDVQSWMMFYMTDTLGKPDVFWTKIGADAATEAERLIKKAGKLAREKAAALTADATGAEEKLARLNDYCRQSILNVAYFPPAGDADRKKLLSERRAPDELIQSGLGNSRDIPVLFIAMAGRWGLTRASSWPRV